MELNYWRLIFTNGQEFIVESEIPDRVKFLKHLEAKGLFGGAAKFLTLKKSEDTESLDIMTDKLFSVQKAKDGSLANQTKKWKLL